ncbi:MAG: biotin-independent malonate decarboxylase subunit gamma [Qingshengfaniella sp.]
MSGDLNTLLDACFATEVQIRKAGAVFSGGAQLADRPVLIVGTTDRTEIGADEALALAGIVLEAVRADAGKAPRDILFIVDNSGQRLAKRDELMGNAGYLAHLSKVLHMARRRGHRILALIHSLALSGGYMATGMAATGSVALGEAEIRVMRLDAMSRITRIPLSRLQDLVQKSAVFGPGVQNYHAIGALDEVWDHPSPARLEQAFANLPDDGVDRRRQQGMERGGRVMAHDVTQRVIQA